MRAHPGEEPSGAATSLPSATASSSADACPANPGGVGLSADASTSPGTVAPSRPDVCNSIVPLSPDEQRAERAKTRGRGRGKGKGRGRGGKAKNEEPEEGAEAEEPSKKRRAKKDKNSSGDKSACNGKASSSGAKPKAKAKAAAARKGKKDSSKSDDAKGPKKKTVRCGQGEKGEEDQDT